MEALYISIANKLEKIRLGGGGGGGKYKIIDAAEIKSVALWRAVGAEFLASMLFVFLGCGSTLGSRSSDRVQISFAFGLAIMSLIQMIGHVSGGHINPAVSIAMAVAMNISVARAVLYVLAQIAGCIVGAFILKGVVPEKEHSNLGVTSLAPGVTPGQGFGIELLLTFVLVTVIFGTTDPNRPSFGSPALLIGLTVTTSHLAAIHLTGGSMNPSRSLGSAVASESWKDHWVYWVGPIAGGVLSALVYKLLLNPYRGVPNMEAAVEKMQQDEGMVVIPRDYFKDGKGKVEQMNASSNL